MNILIILFISCYVESKEVLRHVHVIYRHGDRSPTEVVSTDSNKHNMWPYGVGQLTDIGIQQHFALGKWLRLRYNSMLRLPYDYKNIQVRSTDVDRTIMSAESNLAGLYYDSSSEIIPGLKWRPIPVHTLKYFSDTLDPAETCNKYRETVLKLWNSDYYQSQFAGFESTLNTVRSVLKDPKLMYQNLWLTFDYLFCEKAHNIAFDSWVTQEIYTNLSKIYDISWKLMYEGEKLGRLSGGRFLDLLVGEMKDFALNNGDKTKPFKMLSGHDQDLAALLSALGIYDGIRPPYASAVMLELLYNPINNLNTLNNWIVKIYYKTKDTDSPTGLTPMNIPGCRSQPCKLDDFIDYVRPTTINKDEYRVVCSGASGVLAKVVLSYALLVTVISTIFNL